MTAQSTDLRKRAERFLRWYPCEWRDRYGEEFVEFLVAELEEQPRSVGRTVDVARSGLLARLASSGLAGRSLDTAEHGRRSLAAFGCAVSLFLTAALAIWAQLTIGWQWSAPDTPATVSAMVLMTVAVIAVAAACIGCAVPVAWSAMPRPCARPPLDNHAPAGPPRRWLRRAHRGHAPFRQRLAGHRGTPVVAPGDRAGRGCRLRVGVHPLRHLVLAPSRGSWPVPGSRGGLDGRQPARPGGRGGRSRQNCPQNRPDRSGSALRAGEWDSSPPAP